MITEASRQSASSAHRDSISTPFRKTPAGTLSIPNAGRGGAPTGFGDNLDSGDDIALGSQNSSLNPFSQFDPSQSRVRPATTTVNNPGRVGGSIAAAGRAGGGFGI